MKHIITLLILCFFNPLLPATNTARAKKISGYFSGTPLETENPMNRDLRSFSFLENKGQLRDDKGNSAPYLLFKAEARNIDLYITDKGLAYVLMDPGQEKEENEKENSRIGFEKIEMELSGARILKENIRMEMPSEEYFNYMGSAGSPNVYGVRRYQKITVKNVYPGIDWLLYDSGEKGFKYDFVVHAGGDPSMIRMLYRSRQRPVIDADGDLKLESGMGRLEESAPLAFWSKDRSVLSSKFYIESTKKTGGRFETLVTYQFPSGLPANYASDLVIDPQLLWCTFYGGSLSEGVYCSDTDNSGNLFICGYGASTNFPLMNSGNFYQTTLSNAYIAKFSNSGVLLWSTYFGPSSTGPFGPSGTGSAYLATDNSGNVFYSGVVALSGLPTVNASSFFQGSLAGSTDAFICKFSGTGVCLWNTYYGGSASEESTGLATDYAGNVFMVGNTSSSNFPLQNNSNYFEGTITGSSSGFIVKFDNSGNRQWATYLKGMLTPRVGTDLSGRVYITGSTNTLVPLMNPGGTAYYQGTIAGTLDAYIVRFSNNGALQWGTYYGGTTNVSNVNDMGTSVVCDKWRNVFICGVTTSTNFPVQNAGSGAYFQSFIPGVNRDVFMLKFDSTATRLWATLIGGSRDDSHVENDNLTVDTCGNVWMGFTSDSRNLPLQMACDGGFFDNSRDTSVTSAQPNVFLTRFSNNGNLIWSSYFGGDGNSHRSTFDADKFGNVFVVGEFALATSTLSYPLVNPGGGAYFTGYSGNDDLFLAKFSTGLPVAQTFTYGSFCLTDTVGHLPQTPLSFAFGGSFVAAPGLSLNPVNGKIFASQSSLGNYTVSYVSQGCNCPGASSTIVGTATVSIISSAIITVSGNTLICTNQTTTLTASGASSYTWNTGAQGPVFSPTITTPGNHVFSVSSSAGGGCGALQTVTVNALPSPTVSVVGNNVCAGSSTSLVAGGAQTYTWNGAAGSPTLQLAGQSAGSYVYTVSGSDVNGCSSTKIYTLNVYPNPTISISGNLNLCPSQTGTLQASGATSYSWSTGAQSSTISSGPAASGSLYYTVTGSLSTGCWSQGTQTVSILNSPSLSISGNNSVCVNALASFTASGATSYSWSNGSQGAQFTVSPQTPGLNTYTVKGTGVNGCEGSTTLTLSANKCTDIRSYSAESGLIVFPNPGKDEISISSETDRNFILVNELGQFIMKIELRSMNNRKVVLRDLAAGVYFLKTADQAEAGIRIVVEK